MRGAARGRMKILFTTFTFAPQSNGVAEVVREQACGLARRGHEVTVATGFDARRTAADAFGQLKIHEFKCSGIFGSRAGYTGELAAYREFVARHETDAIICHGWENWSTDLIFPVLARKHAVRVLVSHGINAHRWRPYRRFSWGLATWGRMLPYALRLPRSLRCFDQMVFLSPRVDFHRFFDHWLLERTGGPRWSAIPNGCWPERFAGGKNEFRQRHGLNTEFVVLCVGVYAVTKGQEATLRAFCAANLGAAVLVFIGNEINDYARHLQALAKSWLPADSPSRVLFLERQDRAAIRSAYQDADLVMLTSHGETQPLVLLDAMAAGKPFLSNDVGCVSEFPGGVVVRRQDQLAATLNALRFDPNRLARLGAAGLAAARNQYHWDNVVDVYDQMLRRLLQERAGKSP